MELSQRLQQVAAYVPSEAILADIGTDHGLLPIWLVQQRRIRKAFACDVRSGPLSRAEQHIREANLQALIETRLSDGFAALQSEPVTAAVIAGMGGRLTARILRDDLASEASVVRRLTDLILQPQSEWDVVRRTLREGGFRTVDETMVEEKGQFYLIIHTKPCAQPDREMETPEDEVWGHILPEKKDPVFRAYLQEEYRKNQQLQALLQQEEPTESLQQRVREVREEERHIREVLETWP